MKKLQDNISQFEDNIQEFEENELQEGTYIRLLEDTNTALYQRLYAVRKKNIFLLLIFLIAGFAFLLTTFLNKHTDEFEGHLKSVAFSKDKLLLSAGENKFYEITDTTQARWYASSGMYIEVDNQHIKFSYAEGTQHQNQQYYELFVPDKSFRLILADGSEALINKHSNIRFTNRRGADINSVFVNGEAYFNIAHNPDEVFNIKASDARVSVFGTEFNVCNYKQDSSTKVTLINGSVMVKAYQQSKTIKPGEMATITQSNKQLEVKYTNVANEIGWTDKQISFKAKKLADILDKISLWYDVKFIVKDTSLLHKHYTGIFKKQEGLLHFLQILQYTMHIHYAINDKFVTLTH